MENGDHLLKLVGDGRGGGARDERPFSLTDSGGD